MHTHIYVAQADLIAEIFLFQSAAVADAMARTYQCGRAEGTVLIVLKNQILVAVVPLCILLFIGERFGSVWQGRIKIICQYNKIPHKYCINLSIWHWEISPSNSFVNFKPIF